MDKLKNSNNFFENQDLFLENSSEILFKISSNYLASENDDSFSINDMHPIEFENTYKTQLQISNKNSVFDYSDFEDSTLDINHLPFFSKLVFPFFPEKSLPFSELKSTGLENLKAQILLHPAPEIAIKDLPDEIKNVPQKYHWLMNYKGKFKNYSWLWPSFKVMAVEAVQQEKLSPKQLELLTKISQKNIRRWVEQGPLRKKGAGRKTSDSEMEKNLVSWIQNLISKQSSSKIIGNIVKRKELMAKAKLFSNNKQFIASKGWCDKFMIRHPELFNRVDKRRAIIKS